MKLLLCLLALSSPALADTQNISGWTLHISDKVDASALKTALPLLSAQLDEITRVVPASAVTELKKVPLWISPEYPSTPPRAEYHPGADWLRDHGRDPAMAKAVEFTNLRIFEAETRRMPNFVLHELAHAYHDRVLGFEHAEVAATFAKAKAAGKNDQVQRRDSEGRVKLATAYAMTNAKEYFAECTEAYFAKNDFFPFNRAELEAHDPEVCILLGRLWNGGSPAGGSGSVR